MNTQRRFLTTVAGAGLAAVSLLALALGSGAGSVSAATSTPVISGVAVSPLGSTTATVRWTTDIAADSQVSYGTTTAYGLSASSSVATTTHAVPLAGLSPSTLYHFRVSSAASSSMATSSDMTFTTLASSTAATTTATSTPLAVTGIDTVRSNATADGTFGSGWRWVLHFTVPGAENAFRMRFSDFTGASGAIAAAGNIRIFSAQSSNAASESAAILETSNAYGDWMYLTGDTAASVAGRQIDVTIDVRIPAGTPTGTYTAIFGAQSVPQSATSTTP